MSNNSHFLLGLSLIFFFNFPVQAQLRVENAEMERDARIYAAVSTYQSMQSKSGIAATALASTFNRMINENATNQINPNGIRMPIDRVAQREQFSRAFIDSRENLADFQNRIEHGLVDPKSLNETIDLAFDTLGAFSGPYGQAAAQGLKAAGHVATFLTSEYINPNYRFVAQTEYAHEYGEIQQNSSQIWKDFYENAQQNPELAKMAIDAMSSWVGTSPFNTSDKNLEQSPLFAQSIQNSESMEAMKSMLSDIMSEQGKTNVSLEDIRTVLEEQGKDVRAMREILEAAQAENIQGQEAKRKANELAEKAKATQSAFFLLSEFLGAVGNDPQLAGQVMAIGQTYMGITNSLANFAKTDKNFGNVLNLSADLVGMALNLVQFFSNSPSPEQIILEQIGMLRDEVHSLHEDMISQFNNTNQLMVDLFTQINQQLNQVYSKLEDNHREVMDHLIDIQMQLGNIQFVQNIMDRKLDESLQNQYLEQEKTLSLNFGRLETLYNHAGSSKMTAADFDEAMDIIDEWIHSQRVIPNTEQIAHSITLSSSEAYRIVSENRGYDAFKAYDFVYHLSLNLDKVGSTIRANHAFLINPGLWIQTADIALKIVAENEEYLRTQNGELTYLDNLIREGERLEQSFKRFKLDSQGNPQIQLFDRLVDFYNAHTIELKRVVENIWRQKESEPRFGGMDLFATYEDYSHPVRYHPAQSNSIVPCVNTPDAINLTVSDQFVQFQPGFFKSLAKLKNQTIGLCYFAEWVEMHEVTQPIRFVAPNPWPTELDNPGEGSFRSPVEKVEHVAGSQLTQRYAKMQLRVFAFFGDSSNHYATYTFRDGFEQPVNETVTPFWLRLSYNNGNPIIDTISETGAQVHKVYSDLYWTTHSPNPFQQWNGILTYPPTQITPIVPELDRLRAESLSVFNAAKNQVDFEIKSMLCSHTEQSPNEGMIYNAINNLNGARDAMLQAYYYGLPEGIMADPGLASALDFENGPMSYYHIYHALCGEQNQDKKLMDFLPSSTNTTAIVRRAEVLKAATQNYLSGPQGRQEESYESFQFLLDRLRRANQRAKNQ